MTPISNIKILKYWNIEILEYWNIEIMIYFKILRYSNIGKYKYNKYKLKDKE